MSLPPLMAKVTIMCSMSHDHLPFVLIAASPAILKGTARHLDAPAGINITPETVTPLTPSGIRAGTTATPMMTHYLPVKCPFSPPIMVGTSPARNLASLCQPPF
ncbi:hypothetical protein FKM82_017452 [Ascaphus truei]